MGDLYLHQTREPEPSDAWACTLHAVRAQRDAADNDWLHGSDGFLSTEYKQRGFSLGITDV